MNKEEFLRGINDVKGITSNDLENLVEASNNYPYCQNLHLLIAKNYQISKHPNAAAKLHTAAIYTPDRHLLKKLIEDNPEYISSRSTFHKKYKESKSLSGLSEGLNIEKKTLEGIATEAENPVGLPKSVEVSFPNLITSTSFIDEKIKFVNKDEITENNQINSELEEASQVVSNNNKISEVTDSNLYDDLENTIQEYKQRKTGVGQNKDIKEGEAQTLENIQATDEPEINQVEKEKNTSPSSVSETKLAEHDKAGKQVESQVEEEENADSIVNEQNQIIEHFIKLNPTLSRFDLKFDEDQPTVEDLSIPKLVIGEHLISENLAVILHKQGKINKAIGIYEKLILKFPEKKAYFTSCIEKINSSK